MEKTKFNTASVLMAGLVAVGIQVAHGQAASNSNSGKQIVPAAAVSKFSNTYNVKVVESDSPMAAMPIDSAPPTGRLRDLQRLADDNGVTWHKVYRVTPAGSGLPVTTLADAQQMADQKGLTTLSLGSVPAVSAMRTIAQADNATVQFISGGTMGAIQLDLQNVPVPQAIASIAKRTHTNWQSVYVITPVSGSQVNPADVAVGPRPTLTAQQNEATNLFNGPITIHVSKDNVNRPPSASGDVAANVPVQSGSGVANGPGAGQPGAIAAVPGAPLPGSYSYADPAYPYNVMNGTYNTGITPITTGGVTLPPGIVEQSPGYNPYLGGSLVLNSGTVTSF